MLDPIIAQAANGPVLGFVFVLIAIGLSVIFGLPDVATRLASIPLRRAGQPEDVANLVAFLASDQTASMTGQAVKVTGGPWMG